MGFSVNGKTIKLCNEACYYIKHSGVLNPKKFGINSIHNINPRITFPETGKSCDLPRIITEEGKLARAMNKRAVEQIKNPIDRTFSKATAEDLKRLTDTSYEASNLRCAFTNPENGEVFHLLSEGQTKEGLKIIRVLDKDGAYLKTIEVKPQKIVILDDYKWINTGENIGITGGWTKEMSHGDFVEVVARRNNPFADYEIISISDDIQKSKINSYKLRAVLEDLQKRIDNGEQIDFLSCSFGSSLENADLLKYAKSKGMTLSDLKHSSPDFDIPLINDGQRLLAQFKEKNPTVRIIKAAGNDGRNAVSNQLVLGDVEGVTALAENGNIAEYSSSRNPLFSPHRERGDFSFIATEHGYSLYGGTSTEIPFNSNVPEVVLRQHGKKPQLPTQEEAARLKELENRVKAEEANRGFVVNEAWNQAPEPSQCQKELDEYSQELFVNRRLLKQVQYNDHNYELVLPEIQGIFGSSVDANFTLDKNGNAMFCIGGINKMRDALCGTSFATPTRSAKLSLYEMLKGLLF